MKYSATVDRIESDMLVLVREDGKTCNVKKDLFTDTFCEGDVCMVEISDTGEVISLKKDPDRTKAKRSEMRSRLSRLFKNK